MPLEETFHRPVPGPRISPRDKSFEERDRNGLSGVAAEVRALQTDRRRWKEMEIDTVDGFRQTALVRNRRRVRNDDYGYWRMENLSADGEYRISIGEGCIRSPEITAAADAPPDVTQLLKEYIVPAAGEFTVADGDSVWLVITTETADGTVDKADGAEFVSISEVFSTHKWTGLDDVEVLVQAGEPSGSSTTSPILLAELSVVGGRLFIDQKEKGAVTIPAVCVSRIDSVEVGFESEEHEICVDGTPETREFLIVPA